MDSNRANEELILAFLLEGGDGFVSGAALSDKLGLSRTAVWKHVEGLRDVGYAIEAQASKGYRLLRVPDRLTALELAPLLTTRELGQQIHSFESIDSTNQAAFALALEGASAGTVVLAETQTAGRGRRGRSWVSPPQKNLAMSCILRPDIGAEHVAELTLVTAVAVAEALESCQVAAKIKWPNDLLVGGKKICGILTELSADTERVHFVVIGIGVNLNSTLDDFPDELGGRVTSVLLERKETVPRALFVAALLAQLELWTDKWADEGFAGVAPAWRARSMTLGKTVTVMSERSEWTGIAQDIDATGALLVRRGDTVERVVSGDVEVLAR